MAIDYNEILIHDVLPYLSTGHITIETCTLFNRIYREVTGGGLDRFLGCSEIDLYI